MRMNSVLPAVLFLACSLAGPPAKRDYLENFYPGSWEGLQTLLLGIFTTKMLHKQCKS